VLVLSVVATVLVASPAQAERSTRAEARLLALMAGERDRTGAPRSSQVDDLTTTASRWSARMADEYGAGGGQGHNPNLAGEVCCARRIAENVGWTSGGHQDLEGAIDRLHAAFMDSQGHRANILSPSHTHVGVGVEVHSSGNVYVTVVFREPDGSAPKATTASPSPSPSPSPAPSPASPPRSPAPPTGSDAPRSSAPSAEPIGQAEMAAPAPASEPTAGLDAEEGAALGPQMRDPQELARLARQAIAEQDRQLKREVLQELEQALVSLTHGASRLIDALRWALGLDRTSALETTGS
jgi:hypothetical protein